MSAGGARRRRAGVRRGCVAAPGAASIERDHAIVSARDRRKAAGPLATIPGAPWAGHGPGPCSPVYVDGGLTLDFIDDRDAFAIQRFCFRADDAVPDAILARLRAPGMSYESTPHGPVDMRVDASLGGRIVDRNEPDGHPWELPTRSDARAPSSAPGERS